MSVSNFVNRAHGTSSGRFSGFKIANKRRFCLFPSTLMLLIPSQCMLGGNAGYLRIRRRFGTELHFSSSTSLFFSKHWPGLVFFLHSGCFSFLSSNLTLCAEKEKGKQHVSVRQIFLLSVLLSCEARRSSEASSAHVSYSAHLSSANSPGKMTRISAQSTGNPPSRFFSFAKYERENNAVQNRSLRLRGPGISKRQKNEPFVLFTLA